MLAILQEIIRIQVIFLAKLADGVDIWQKSRPLVPQGVGVKVNHIHFHILPSLKQEELYNQGIIWSLDRFNQFQAEEARAILQLLK